MGFWEREDGGWPWPYLLVFTFALIDAIWIVSTPIEIARSSIWVICLIVAAAVGLIHFSNRIRHNEQGYVLVSALAFFLLAWPALRIFNHLSMTLSLPLADDMLSKVDIAMGFDWPAYITWLNANHRFFYSIEWTYASLDKYSAVFLIIWALCDDKKERCFEFIALFITSSSLCMVIGALFPALGSVAFYAMDYTKLEYIDPTMGRYAIDDIVSLRENIAPVLNLSKLPGLVTFPSFHSALGLLIIYVCRKKLWLFILSAIVNLLMIATTPLLGGHYFVDLIGAVFFALLSIAIVNAANTISARHARNASSLDGFSTPTSIPT